MEELFVRRTNGGEGAAEGGLAVEDEVLQAVERDQAGHRWGGAEGGHVGERLFDRLGVEPAQAVSARGEGEPGGAVGFAPGQGLLQGEHIGLGLGVLTQAEVRRQGHRAVRAGRREAELGTPGDAGLDLGLGQRGGGGGDGGQHAEEEGGERPDGQRAEQA